MILESLASEEQEGENYMRIWRPECPRCGARLNRATVKAGVPFACPSCGVLLRIPSFYFWFPALASAGVCGLVGYVLGFRSSKLVALILAFWLPVAVAFGTLLHSAFVPKIEQSSPDSLDLFPRK